MSDVVLVVQPQTVATLVVAPQGLPGPPGIQGVPGQPGASGTILDEFLVAVNNLALAADQLAYATGPSSAAATALTAFARTLLAATSAAAARAALGAAAAADIPANPALRDGANTFTGANTFKSGAAGETPVKVQRTGATTIDYIAMSHDGSGKLESVGGELRITSWGNVRIYSVGSASALVRNSNDTANLLSIDGTGCVQTYGPLVVGAGGDVGLVAEGGGVARVSAGATGNGILKGHFRPHSFTFGTLPTASIYAGCDVSVTDRAGIRVYSDGANWRRFSDDTVLT